MLILDEKYKNRNEINNITFSFIFFVENNKLTGVYYNKDIVILLIWVICFMSVKL